MLRARGGGAARALWDEGDVWLIAYPDHFQRAGEPPLETLRRFHLDHLAGSFNGVHVLPFFPSSSDAGFSVTDYLAVAPDLGTWDDVRKLGTGTRLMVDAVVNHASAEGEWFDGWRRGVAEYEGFFRVADPASDLTAVVRAREHPLLTPFSTADGEQYVWTTFSADQADLDYRNPEVLLRMLDVLLTYVERGAQAIRLDAVGFLWKEEGTSSIHLPQTHRLVQFFRSCLDEAFPGTLLVTETNVPHRENVSYFGTGSSEAHVVYQFPLPPLTLHAFTTGDAGPLAGFLDDLGAMAPGTAFLNFLGSHDGVGLRPAEGLLSSQDIDRMVLVSELSGGMVSSRAGPGGETVPYELNATWFDLVAGENNGDDALQRHLASHAIMLAIKGIPAIYAGSLLAIASDPAAAARSAVARDINRRRELDTDRLERELAEPSSAPAQALNGMKQIIALRRTQSAFHPDSAQSVSSPVPGVVAIDRHAADGTSAAVFVNVADGPADLPAPQGSRIEGRRIEDSDGRLRLGPWGYAWMTARRRR